MTLSIDRRAAQWGDRTAVVDVSEEGLYVPAETVDEDRVSYATLAALARDLTASLDARNVGAGDVVCSCSRNRVAVLALLFACRRLGATLAPISHRLTPATVDRPLSRLEPTLVIHERAQRDLVRDVAPSRSVALDELDGTGDRSGTGSERDGSEQDGSERDGSERDGGERDGAAVERSADAAAVPDADDGAPLLALHGEGGTPVVRFDARAVEWNCITAAATWGLGRGDRAMTLRPLASHDGLFRVALPLLYVGGSVVIDRAFDPGDALAAIDRERVTVLAGRDPEFTDLIDRDGASDAMESVAWGVSDGGVDEAVRSAFAASGVPLREAYGPLECPNALADGADDPNTLGDRADDTNALTDGVDDSIASGGASNEEARRRATDRGVGAPMVDCAVRLVADGDVVSGSGTGRLQLSGPVLASGYVRENGAGDGPGEFVDGWFDTGARFRRAEDGRYHRRT